MMHLIEPHAEERVLLIEPDGSEITAQGWLTRTAVEDIAAWQSQYRHQRVAVLTADNAERARALLLLDGVAAALLLLSVELPEEALHSLLERAKPDRILRSAKAGSLILNLPSAPLPDFSFRPANSGEEVAPPSSIVTEWLLATSGTTKTPKLVCHTLQSLARSVRRRGEGDVPLRWGLLYDLDRFAGLQVFLQAVIGGDILLIPPAHATLPSIVDWFAEHECDAISATPTLWRKLLMTPGSRQLRLKQITLGGEIADQLVLDALHTQYPDARIVHIYASTEAGVGFAVADGQEGFPRAFLDQGVKGANLCIDAHGVLCIRPQGAEQRYLGEDSPLVDAQGYVNTGDRVEVVADRIFFRGRDNGAINVGGNKVQPEEVERVLLAHPEVALAAVGAKRSSITGALVTACIVPTQECVNPTELPRRLHDWCNTKLPRYKVPALIRVVTDIPINATGKLTRQP